MKKVIISTDALRSALKKLSQAMSKKPVLPVLSNLYLKVYEKEVELITTDLELTILVECSCESKDTFEMLVPFEFLQKVVSLSGSQPLRIEMNGNKGRIIGENDTYELGSLDKVKDYPNLPEFPKEHFVTMNGTFISWLNRAQVTCSDDEGRPAMTKICLDINEKGAVMASTDATMIFTHSFPVESAVMDQLLIAPKIAKALEGFDSTEIYWHKQHIAFKSGNITVIATRHEDKFPDYKVVFPQTEANLLLDRAAVVEALERAVLIPSTHTDIHLKKQPGTVHFEIEDMDLNRKIQVDIAGSYQGDVEKVGVNAKKMLALMNQVEYDKINLHIHDPQKPILITAESDPDYRSLIVPLIINE